MKQTTRIALWRLTAGLAGLVMIVSPLYANSFYGDPLPTNAFRLVLGAAGVSLLARLTVLARLLKGAVATRTLPFASAANGLLLAASACLLKDQHGLFLFCATVAIVSLAVDAATVVSRPEKLDLAYRDGEGYRWVETIGGQRYPDLEAGVADFVRKNGVAFEDAQTLELLDSLASISHQLGMTDPTPTIRRVQRFKALLLKERAASQVDGKENAVG
jgi:hypothetical protein